MATSIKVHSKQEIPSDSGLRFLKDPVDYLNMGGHKVIHIVKQGIFYVGSVTGAPCNYANIVRKVVESIGPSLTFLTDTLTQWRVCAKDFAGAIAAIDLLEIINDINYFVNGGYLKDRMKKHYYSIAGHIALLPANIITVGLYLKDAFNMSFKALGAFAAGIGNIRIFGFVPKVAQWVQGWPLFRSIPNLAGKAARIGNVKVFSWVPNLSMATLATAVVGVAYVYFAVDSKQRQKKYAQKTAEYSYELFKSYNISVKPNSSDIKAALHDAKIAARDDREKIGKVFAKYKHNVIKEKQARLDLHASVSEIALKAATLGGLTAGATVAGSVVFAVLGSIALFAVGRAFFHRLSAGGKPELGAVI